jgi:hypothetical protein
MMMMTMVMIIIIILGNSWERIDNRQALQRAQPLLLLLQ